MMNNIKKMNQKTVQRVLNEATDLLIKAENSNPRQEAIMLMEYALGLSKIEILTYPNKIITDEEYNMYIDKIKRRQKKEPLQYITARQEFMGIDFEVNPSVLIPRQDTEVLIETIVSKFKSNNKYPINQVLDVCTGSGCIAISLSKLININSIIALDLSEKALDVAKRNAEKNKVNNIQFIESNMFSNLSEDLYNQFDIVVSNPPYIPTDDIDYLMDEVRIHEPMLALDGMEDGLFFYRILAKESKKYLNDNGMIFLEIGYDQGEKVRELLLEEGYNNIEIIKDLANLNRVVCASKE